MIQILYNGIIHSNVAKIECNSAIAIANGIILATGSDDEILSNYRHKAVLTNLEKRTVLPGFTDSHIHLLRYAQNLQRVDCETDSIEECLVRVAEKNKLNLKGKWILGHGWNQNLWNGAYGNKSMLDSITRDPVYLTHKSLHASWANSKALEIANITKESSNPAGGAIQKDGSGEPTGILFEKAMSLVEDKIPNPSPSDNIAAIKQAQLKLNQLGFTGVHDFDAMDCFDALETMLSESQLCLRVVKGLPLVCLDEVIKLSLQTGFGDPLLKFGCVKIFADGALGPQTAAMLRPYESTSDNMGMLLLDEAEIIEIGKKAAKAGLALAIHAIGDKANQVSIKALSEVISFSIANHLRPLRHRIEHLQLLAPPDLENIKNSGIIASMQPYHMISDQMMAERYWGSRNEFAYAWKSVLDSGTVLIFGSDAPVESPDPFPAIQAAMTRRPIGYLNPDGWYPQQKLSFIDALLAYTMGPAYAAGCEKVIGKLEVNYEADLIILDENPFFIQPDRLLEIKISATMVRGKWVWKGF